MASKKKTTPKVNPCASEIRYVILSDGTEEEVVREDGKYYYTATSQFRRATHSVKTVVREQEKPVEAEANQEAE